MKNLVHLELFPIVLAVKLWGDAFHNRKVRFNCDNMGVVTAINSISASPLPVVRLLRHLVLLCLRLNAFIYAVHIPEVTNKIVDALSHSQWTEFRALAHGGGAAWDTCPPGLWKVVLESSQV